MKIRLFITIFLLLMVLSSKSFATVPWGGMGSGGGKAYVCFSMVNIADTVRQNSGRVSSFFLRHITFIETFDLFYAKLMNAGDDIPESSMMKSLPSENYLSFLDRIIKKIDSDDSYLADEILNGKEAFREKVIMVQNSPLDPTNDINYPGSVNTSNCTLTNIAVQKWDNKTQSYQLLIDDRLFSHKKFSEDSKATLFLHEYIYLLARKNGERDSKSTRELIRAILNKESDINISGQYSYLY